MCGKCRIWEGSKGWQKRMGWFKFLHQNVSMNASTIREDSACLWIEASRRLKKGLRAQCKSVWSPGFRSSSSPLLSTKQAKKTKNTYQQSIPIATHTAWRKSSEASMMVVMYCFFTQMMVILMSIFLKIPVSWYIFII